MNADERYDIMFDEIFDLKQEVKELQGKLSKLENRIAAEGFSDLETMISKYKTVMLAANEISIETDEEIESLKAQLAEAERRERAAVEDLKFACGSQPSASAEDSICDICKQKQEDGSCPKQLAMDFLNTDSHIFVPRDLYGKYKPQGWDKKRFERRAEK